MSFYDIVAIVGSIACILQFAIHFYEGGTWSTFFYEED